jgi:CYTH domain-containing protein
MTQELLELMRTTRTFEEEEFEKPHWLGMEVTGDERFYNAYLSKHPYQSW